MSDDSPAIGANFINSLPFILTSIYNEEQKVRYAKCFIFNKNPKNKYNVHAGNHPSIVATFIEWLMRYLNLIIYIKIEIIH